VSGLGRMRMFSGNGTGRKWTRLLPKQHGGAVTWTVVWRSAQRSSEPESPRQWQTSKTIQGPAHPLSPPSHNLVSLKSLEPCFPLTVTPSHDKAHPHDQCHLSIRSTFMVHVRDAARAAVPPHMPTHMPTHVHMPQAHARLRPQDQFHRTSHTRTHHVD
jgi:hypothetical protein